MDNYIHRVSGIFSHRDAANRALSELSDKGIPKNRLQLFDSTTTLPASSQQSKSNEVLKDILMDGVIGAVFGIGVGTLAEIALIAANVTLFVSSPIITPLALLGWGSALGATVGAAVGAKVRSKQKGWLPNLIKDAISNGQVLLVAKTLSKHETEIAQETLKPLVENYKNISNVKA